MADLNRLKMSNFKLLLLSFSITFFGTALLSLAFFQPLIFYPIDYGLMQFSRLALLLAMLSLALVYFTFPILQVIARIFKIKSRLPLYYLAMSLVVLQLVTLVLGYIESSITRGVTPDFWYYYSCVSNSCFYLLAGNSATIVTSYLYGLKEKRFAEIVAEHQSPNSGF